MDKKVIKNSFRLLLITANLLSIPNTVTVSREEKYDPQLQKAILHSMEDQVDKKKIQINRILIVENKNLTKMNEGLNAENRKLTEINLIQESQNKLLHAEIKRLRGSSQKRSSPRHSTTMENESELLKKKSESLIIPETHTLQASQRVYIRYEKELIGAFLLLLGGNLYFLGKALAPSLKANSAKRNPKKAATPSKRDKKYKRSGKKRGMPRLR